MFTNKFIIEITKLRNKIAYDEAVVKNTEEDFIIFISKYHLIYICTCQSERFIPTRGKGGEYGIPANKAETLASLKDQFEVLRSKLAKDATKAGKIEQKISLLQHGYVQRAERIWQNIDSLYASLNSTLSEKGCFEMLATAEERVLPYRIQTLVDLKERAEIVEGEMQRQYAEMMRLQEV